MTTTLDTVPVAVYSIQFLEVDPDFNVINQDSSYVRDIDFVDGTVFTYASIIETSTTIPGGMNMVLRGVNAAGDPVRNVFTITYTNDCGVPTFEVGDSIGWVIFEDFVPASEETCPTRTIATGAPTTPTAVVVPTAPRRPSEQGDPSTESYHRGRGGACR
ncbi:hypothetical protein ACHAW5_006014 [Stephanodiscus triporus]|uniref:Uncharacterized protein n=1 Tax=Stephanodiscus triporus TaxID=2934178 RepID=A0ABD3NJZ2_9STRA